MPTLRDRLKPLIPQIVSRELTNRAAARALGASEFTISRLLKQMKVVRNPPPTRDSQQALLAARKQARKEAANNTELTVDQAAKSAHCSTRTIYRYRDK